MKYDQIVVGAGSGGGVMATRLSEDPQRSVLLLEAGPDYPDFAQLPEEIKFGFSSGVDTVTTHHNWEFTGRGTDTSRELFIPRGRITGGTSAINGQVFLRGVPEDYDGWAAAGNGEWGFQRLLPYFRKVETDTEFGGSDFHNSDGPIVCRRFPQAEWLPAQQAFYAACRSLGYAEAPDHNHPDASGVGPAPLNNPNGIRMSTALGYLGLARHRLNLTIRANCTARRVLFEGRRAVGVEVESGGEIFAVEGEEIILCGGAIASPQLLLLSGVGPAAHLAELGISLVGDLPGVGQGLRDHPTFFVPFQTRPGFALDHTAPRLQVTLRYTAPGSPLRNDLQILMSNLINPRLYPGDTDGWESESLGVGMYAVINQEEAAGELRLTSADPHARPALDFRFFEGEFDLMRARELLRTCAEIARHPAFADIIEQRLEPSDDELADDAALNAFIRRTVVSGQHLTSTCKMGPDSDPLAVVNQYGQVYGVTGLRVADASVMPNCIRANTNLTTMMIGERIADFIKAA